MTEASSTRPPRLPGCPDTCATLRWGVMLINTGRGALVGTAALIER
ncbi:hypothetical protein [Methylobacterium sp. B4]|nr:hypothetical protein [Methylobacterium sp. B4]